MLLMNRIRQHKNIVILFTLFFLISLPISSEEQMEIPVDITKEIVSPTANSTKIAVIFDLGNVLITTSKKAAFDQIGAWKITKYLTCDFKTPEAIPPILYDLLNKTRGQRINNSINDPYGNCLPDIFCEALTGKKTERECLTEVLQIIEKNKKHFCSKREWKIAKILAKFMFDSHTLCGLQIINKDALNLLRICVQRGHEVFIFSNFAPHAFDLIKDKFPEIFSLIPNDHIIVSGHIGHAKPNQDSYYELVNRLKKFNIHVENSRVFFMDDQIENISPVAAHGITGIVYNENNHSQTHKILASYQII